MVFMNQRREPRLEADQSVWITLFGEPDIRLHARVKNVSTRGIGLELQGPVAIGSPVKIELEDCLFLGEVIYCRQDEASFLWGWNSSRHSTDLPNSLGRWHLLGFALRPSAG